MSGRRDDATSGVVIATVTAVCAYALERRRIDALIPTRPSRSRAPCRCAAFAMMLGTTPSNARAARSCVPAGGSSTAASFTHAPFAGEHLPVQGPGQSGARDRRRLSRPPQSPALHANAGRTTTSASTNDIAGARGVFTARRPPMFVAMPTEHRLPPSLRVDK